MYAFFHFLCSKIILTKNYFHTAEINLTTRGPLYTCLVTICIWVSAVFYLEFYLSFYTFVNWSYCYNNWYFDVVCLWRKATPLRTSSFISLCSFFNLLSASIGALQFFRESHICSLLFLICPLYIPKLLYPFCIHTSLSVSLCLHFWNCQMHT